VRWKIGLVSMQSWGQAKVIDRLVLKTRTVNVVLQSILLHKLGLTATVKSMLWAWKLLKLLEWCPARPWFWQFSRVFVRHCGIAICTLKPWCLILLMLKNIKSIFGSGKRLSPSIAFGKTVGCICFSGNPLQEG